MGARRKKIKLKKKPFKPMKPEDFDETRVFCFVELLMSMKKYDTKRR